MGFPWSVLTGLLSPQDRMRLAKAVGAPAEPKALGEALGNPRRIAAAIRQTSKSARDLLRRLWLAGGQTPVYNLQRVPAVCRDALPELTNLGLVVQVWVDYYQQHYAVPLEVQGEVARTLMREVLAERVPAGPPVSPADVPAHDVWFTDLFRILSHFRWFGAPVTQQGHLYKRTHNQILPLLWPQHPVPPGQRLDMLIQFALYARLLQYNRLERHFEVTEEAEGFFDQPPSERWRTWWDFWTHAQVERTPVGPVMWDLLMLAPESGRLGVPDLVDLVVSSGLVNKDVAQSTASQLVGTGRILGWLDVGRQGVALSALARGVLAGRFLPDPPSRAVVQPNADVLVPVETPLGLVWRAEETLTLKQADVVWTYRFDEPALERGVNLPLTADEALERLAALSRTELPANVVADVRDGYLRADKVRILDTMVVVGQTREITDVVALLLGDLVAARLADTVLALPAASAPEAIRRLRATGYPVRSRPERLGVEPARGLAKVVAVEPLYRPTLSASLPGPPAPPPARVMDDPFEELYGAIRAGDTGRVVYVPDGDDRMREARLRPFAIDDGVLRGIRTDTQAPIALPVDRILEVRRT